VREGVIAYKIAAYSAGIARGRKGAQSRRRALTRTLRMCRSDLLETPA
jgi:thiamine biosynthesis protein ThiC